MPSAPAPSTGNYSILKAEVKFLKDGEVAYRHLGNAPTIQFTINVDVLDHFSSMAGIRSKDFTVVREKSAQIVLTLDEWDPENVAMAVLGTVTGSPATIDIMSESAITGALRIVGTNDVGVRCQWDFPNVSFRPSGALDLISEEFATMELTGDVLIEAGSFGTVTTDITEEVLSGSPPL